MSSFVSFAPDPAGGAFGSFEKSTVADIVSLTTSVTVFPLSAKLVIAGKTNTQSNTAFRGFGGPQGAIAIEYIIDNMARELRCDPLDVRKANFYGKITADSTITVSSPVTVGTMAL